MANVVANSVKLQNTVFQDSTVVANVDLSSVPFVNNDASFAFANCTNLVNVTNINQNVTEMVGAFSGCTALTVAPSIPNSVVNTSTVIKEKQYYAFDLNTPFSMYGQTFNYVLSLTPVPSSSLYVNEGGYFARLYEAQITSANATAVEFSYEDWMNGTTTNYLGTRNSLNDDKEELHESQWINIGLFSNCTNLTDAILPEIGDANFAFSLCPSLVNATIGYGPTELNQTFYGCQLLQNVTIPNSVTSLYNTFYFCNSLTSVNIPNSVVNMAESFKNCIGLTSINLPESVVNLYNAFIGCTNLTGAVHIPNSVTDITNAFYNTGITSVTQIPNSITNLTNAFRNCKSLQTFPNIPDSVTNMSGAFAHCDNVAGTITLPNSVTDLTATFQYCNNATALGSMVIPNSVYKMTDTFYGCTNWTNYPTVPDSVCIADGTFCSCSKYPALPNHIFRMYFTYGYTKLQGPFPGLPSMATELYYTFYGSYINTINVTLPNNVRDLSGTFESCGYVRKAPVIPNTVVNMWHTFRNDSALVNIFNMPSIPKSVFDSSHTFDGCSALTNAPVIESGSTNCVNTFNYCNKVSTFYIRSGVVYNARDCFNRTTHAKTVYIPFGNTKTYNAFIAAGYTTNGSKNGVTLAEYPNCARIGNYYIDKSTGTILDIITDDTTITVPSSVSDGTNTYQINYISDSLFYNRQNLEAIDMNNIPTEGNTIYFANCYNLAAVTNIPNTIRLVDLHNTNITNISLPESVTCMNWTFRGGSKLTEFMHFPSNVECLNTAFGYNDDLTTVGNIPSTVIDMRDTFSSCNKLTGNIVIESENVYRCTGVFNYTNLTKNVYIPFTYANGVPTRTYNSFTFEGYSAENRKDGVLLFDLNDIYTQVKLSDCTYTVDNGVATITDMPIPEGTEQIKFPEIEE